MQPSHNMEQPANLAASDTRFEITYATRPDASTDWEYYVVELDATKLLIELLTSPPRPETAKDGYIFAKPKGCLLPRGRSLKLRDIEGVCALVLDVHNTDRLCWDVGYPYSPDRLRELLAFSGVMYSTDTTGPVCDRMRIILLLDRMHSLQEFHRLTAWVMRLFPSSGITPLAPNRLIEAPQCTMQEAIEESAWLVELKGPKLCVDMVPSDFREPIFLEPKVPTAHHSAVLAALLNGKMWSWAKKNAKSLSPQLRHGIATNLAAIVNEDLDALNACVAAATLLFPNGEGDAEALLAAAAKEEPMTWLDLSGHGLPPPYGRELTPVADARAEAAMGDANPTKYLFNVSTNRYEILQADGSYLQDILPEALATMLAPTIGDRKAIERFMKMQIPHYKKRAPVYESIERLVEHNGLMTFNTFVPTSIVPREGDWSDIRALVMNLVGEDRREEALEFFLDWLALLVQSIYLLLAPLKMLTAVVLHGEQGSGKGTLVEVLEMLYPAGSVITVDQERLEERFSSWNADTLLLVANEVNSGTTKEKTLANKLKRLITDPTVVVEEKGEKAQPNTKNKMSLLFCSNDDRPVRIERGDRRFIVFHSRTKLPQSLIKALRADMSGPRSQVAAFFHHLLHRQVQIAVNTQFETTAWRLMQNASLSAVEKAVDEMRVVGYRSMAAAWENADDKRFDEARVATAVGSPDGCEHIPSRELICVLKHWARSQGLSVPDTIDTPLRNALKAAFPEASAGRASIKGRGQERVWLGLPLDVDADGKVTRRSGEKAPDSVPPSGMSPAKVPPGTAKDFAN